MAAWLSAEHIPVPGMMRPEAGSIAQAAVFEVGKTPL